MSVKLLDEKPLVILPGLAVAIGLNEAIVLQQVNYWLKEAAQKPHLGRRHDNRVWIYNDYERWQKQNFPFWSVSTIKRAVYSLEKQDLLITEIEENPDYKGGKRKWYAINYDTVQSLGCVQNDTTPQVKMTRGSVQNDTFYNKESETTTETTQKEKIIAAEPQAPTAADEPTPKRLPNLQQLLFEAICKLFEYDMDKLTPTEKKKIGQIASELRQGGCQPEQVKPFWEWIQALAIKEKWRSQPSMHTMKTKWSDYANTLKPVKVLHVPVPQWRIDAGLEPGLDKTG